MRTACCILPLPPPPPLPRDPQQHKKARHLVFFLFVSLLAQTTPAQPAGGHLTFGRFASSELDPTGSQEKCSTARALQVFPSATPLSLPLGAGCWASPPRISRDAATEQNARDQLTKTLPDGSLLATTVSTAAKRPCNEPALLSDSPMRLSRTEEKQRAFAVGRACVRRVLVAGAFGNVSRRGRHRASEHCQQRYASSFAQHHRSRRQTMERATQQRFRAWGLSSRRTY